MQEISDNIFIETEYPGVTVGALVFPHGTILIDAPLRAEDARSWRSAMVNQGSSANRILVNLDTHPDRTLGARAMECSVIAHQKAAQLFRSRPSVFKGQNNESGSEWETYSETVGMRWAIPDITFMQRLFLHWGPKEVVLEHHPGPSSGAIWAIIPDVKLVFVGDAVLHNQPPFIANAEIDVWQEALEVLRKEFKNYTIISGRGGPVPQEAVRTQQNVLKNVLKGMERLSKRNASPEATESLVSGLLAGMTFPPHFEEHYFQRLRHGLNQYYARRYRQQDVTNQLRMGEEEQ